MRKVLLSRFGAFGDLIHCTHIPRLLKMEGFDYVAFQYNHKGIDVFANNPYIDEHIHFNPYEYPIAEYPVSFLEKRLQYMKEQGGYEKVINLQNSIERDYIAMEDMNEYYMSSATRRQKFGKHNYYDQTTLFAGYPKHVGMKGELYFTEDEERVVRYIYEEKYKGQFVVIANLSGSSKQKLFYNAEHICKKFLKRHPDAVVITMGDQDCKEHVEFQGERIINRSGKFGERGYPFRQSMLMTKYANLVIGCESGLMVAATLLGAPTVQLMTAASIKNHGGDFKNDFSLQSQVHCSPCHKGPYDFLGCPKFEHMGMQYPSCIRFDSETVLQRMEEVYDYYRTTKKIIAD